MKTKTLIQLAVLGVIVFLISSPIAAEDFTRSYEKKFEVDKGANLNIVNKFGDLNCRTWSESAISIKVTITVDASSAEKANKVFDKISISLEGDRGNVNGVTKIDGSFNNVEFSIDYDVMLPPDANIDLTNRFGDIIFGSTQGSALITLEYGQMEGSSFKGPNSEFNIKFSEAEIDEVGNGIVNVEYGEWDNDAAGDLQIMSRFSTVEVGDMGNLDLDSQYDDVEIGSARNTVVIARFSEVTIGGVKGSFSVDVQYGEAGISSISAGFGTGVVSNQFADVSLGFASGTSCNVEAELSFGDLSYPSAFAFLSHEEKGYTTNIYKGTIGSNKSPQDRLVINSKNAGVKIDFK